jgi:hypothetical protein
VNVCDDVVQNFDRLFWHPRLLGRPD